MDIEPICFSSECPSRRLAVNQMDQVTQQNAAMVEQSTAASLSLSREAAELADLVGRFETSQVAAAPSPIHKAQARVESFARAHAPPLRAPVWRQGVMARRWRSWRRVGKSSKNKPLPA